MFFSLPLGYYFHKMLEVVIYVSLVGFGFAVGLGVATRLYTAKSHLFMEQIKDALDSTGIRRDEFLPVRYQTSELEKRVRHLEAIVSRLPQR